MCMYISILSGKLTFNESKYAVKENQGVLKVSLDLSQPLSTTITVQILDSSTDKTMPANGDSKLCFVL